MRAAALAAVLAVALAGCVQMQPPAHIDSAFVPAARWDHQVSVHLGPRMLRVALPLLVARQSPDAPLYFRHLDHVAVSIYAADGSGETSPVTNWPSEDEWTVVLRVRDDESTISLLHGTAAPTLDRFYVVMDDGAERVVTYAEGHLWKLVRQALRNEL